MTEYIPTTVEQELLGIKYLLWGNNIKPDIFSRWSQGFYFSTCEPSALEQTHGGPCSIIAPLQAFIVKNLLLEYEDEGLEFRNGITETKQNSLLVASIMEILDQCMTNEEYRVAYLAPDNMQDSTTTINGEGGLNESILTGEYFLEHPTFHRNLRLQTFSNSQEFLHYMQKNVHKFKTNFGVLLFLYSVIATKGLEKVKLEIDAIDPLIDEVHGYGSQSLINLVITGRAVTYVWDHEQDVGGLKLKGLNKQSKVGFITLMEHLRLCTVGSFFKNPLHPVWILGSETHLTVLFSSNRRIVSPETKSEQARRVFKNYDKDGNNFISADMLQDVLSELELVSDKAYVEIMRKKIDSENLGIILLNAFMDEFFPKEELSTPDTFQLVHYNGLGMSNPECLIKYRIGNAILLESDLRAMSESNPMLTCLQTKWPNIEVNWLNNVTPSLN